MKRPQPRQPVTRKIKRESSIGADEVKNVRVKTAEIKGGGINI